MFILVSFQREGEPDSGKHVYVHPKTNHKLPGEMVSSKLHMSKSVLALQTVNNNSENWVTGVMVSGIMCQVSCVKCHEEVSSDEE